MKYMWWSNIFTSMPQYVLPLFFPLFELRLIEFSKSSKQNSIIHENIYEWKEHFREWRKLPKTFLLRSRESNLLCGWWVIFSVHAYFYVVLSSCGAVYTTGRCSLYSMLLHTHEPRLFILKRNLNICSTFKICCNKYLLLNICLAINLPFYSKIIKCGI